MGVVEQSHETVESYISALERLYGSFSINQSTLSVLPAEYERERERASDGCVDLYVTVTNEQAEVLHIEDGDERVVPSTRIEGFPQATAATEFVENETGVACRVENIGQVTILGIRDSASDREMVYRLAVVLEASPVAESDDGEADLSSTDEQAVWQASSAVPEIVAP